MGEPALRRDRHRRTARGVLALLAVALPGAAVQALPQEPSGAEPPAVRIHVVSHGWHTGLVLPLDARLLRACPALEDFRGHRAVEIGWGDEGFYRAAHITFATAWRAIFWPTPTVLHVAAVDRPPAQEFWASDVVALDLDDAGYQALLDKVAGTFADRQPLGPGLYGTSRFYRAKGSYYFPNTCNVWTLRLLAQAGVPTRPLLGTRAPSAMAQVAAAGTPLRMTPPPARWPHGLAWLGGLTAGLWLRVRRNRPFRRRWVRALASPWPWALLGGGASLGLLLVSANAREGSALGAGVPWGIGLVSLAAGWAASRPSQPIAGRVPIRRGAAILFSLAWVFLVLGGA